MTSLNNNHCPRKFTTAASLRGKRKTEFLVNDFAEANSKEESTRKLRDCFVAIRT
jgi:hypothetical protein